MGKNKGKNKDGASGSESDIRIKGRNTLANENIDPTIAEMLARPTCCGAAAAAPGTSKIKKVVAAAAPDEGKIKNATAAAALGETIADSREAMMLPIQICPKGVRFRANNNLEEPLDDCSDGKETEVESDAASQTLGEDDSDNYPGVRQNASEKDETVLSDNSESAEGRKVVKATQGVKKASYASLLASNRLPSMGSKLEHFHKVNGTMEIKAEEVQDQESPWKCCLVGYFGGKFPGKQALNQIVIGLEGPG